MFTFFKRPWFVQSCFGNFKRLASSLWVARTLRSFNKTYHNLWRSSNDLRRSSWAFQARPIILLLITELAVLYTRSLPVQICFGKASLFSKNWYKPVGLAGVAVVVVVADSARAILAVLKERLVTFKERVILCKMDIFDSSKWKRIRLKIGRDLLVEFCEGGEEYFFFFRCSPVWLDLNQTYRTLNKEEKKDRSTTRNPLT